MRPIRGGAVTGSTQEYLLSYLQWLDAGPGRAARLVPAGGWSRRCRATACGGWTGRPSSKKPSSGCSARSAGSPTWCRRLPRSSSAGCATSAELIRSRRRRRCGPGSTGWRPIAGRQRVVADLARDVRFHYFDEPLLRVTVTDESPGHGAIWTRCRTSPTARSGPTASTASSVPAAAAGRAAAPVARHRRPGAAPGAAGGLHRGASTGSGNCATSRSTEHGRVAARLRRLRLGPRASPSTSSPRTHRWRSCRSCRGPSPRTSARADIGPAGRRRPGAVAPRRRLDEGRTTLGQRSHPRRGRKIAGRLRLRPAAAAAGPHRHDRRGADAGALPHPPLDLPPAGRPVRRGTALPQPAPDARQAAGPVAAVELHPAPAALGRGRLRVPRRRARQPRRPAAFRARRGARPDAGPARRAARCATRGWN